MVSTWKTSERTTFNNFISIILIQSFPENIADKITRNNNQAIPKVSKTITTLNQNKRSSLNVATEYKKHFQAYFFKRILIIISVRAIKGEIGFPETRRYKGWLLSLFRIRTSKFLLRLGCSYLFSTLRLTPYIVLILFLIFRQFWGFFLFYSSIFIL